MEVSVLPFINFFLCRDVLHMRHSLCLIKRIVETFINTPGEKPESPMGFEPMTFQTPGGYSTD